MSLRSYLQEKQDPPRLRLGGRQAGKQARSERPKSKGRPSTSFGSSSLTPLRMHPSTEFIPSDVEGLRMLWRDGIPCSVLRPSLARAKPRHSAQNPLAPRAERAAERRGRSRRGGRSESPRPNGIVAGRMSGNEPHADSAFSGNVNLTVVPSPTALTAPISPPCAVTRFLAIASPSPVPFESVDL